VTSRRKVGSANNPGGLIVFYWEDSFYADSASKEGPNGQSQILPHSKMLLVSKLDWELEAVVMLSADKDFLLQDGRLRCQFGSEVVVENGVDIVETENGKITQEMWSTSIAQNGLTLHKTKIATSGDLKIT
jgi:hypothetical protein